MDNRPKHIISIDYEEWFQVNSFTRVVGRQDWERMERRLPAQTDILLELFAHHRVQATFFIVGWIAEQYPELVRRIAVQGHEIASHSRHHQLLVQQGPAGFRQDVRQSKQTLEDLVQQPVIGYRAPNWSLTPTTLWATEILYEEGIRYDSSVFPMALGYGQGAPRFRFTWPSGLIEYPLSTLRWAGINLPVGGGIFFRAQPVWLTMHAIRAYERCAQPFILYLHPWEIDPDHPRLAVGFKKRLVHYHGPHSTLPKLRELCRSYSFTSFRQLEQDARIISEPV